MSWAAWYPGIETTQAATGGGRTTKNTRSAPLGLEVGMGWRGTLLVGLLWMGELVRRMGL